MNQAPQLSPEIVQSVAAFARALMAAARAWALYPPEHPTVVAAVDRLAAAVDGATGGAVFELAITPDALLFDGVAVGRPGEGALAEAAALLHDRDILRITFTGNITRPTLQALLTLLALDAEARLARGGPAAAWAADGHPSIAIEQIDYQKVLEDREEPNDGRRRDDLWHAIARAIVEGRFELDAPAQERLLEIAGDPIDIADLAREVMAAGHAADGSPMITTQAATVLAAFRRLASIVSVMAADRASALVRNLSEAASHLDPKVVLQMIRAGEESGGALAAQDFTAAFDDVQVARLLAAALASEGRASARLADVFHALAPDGERKRRVLRLTRSLLSESAFGRSGQLQVLWSSMEELLLSYDESPYVSDHYRAALDGAGARARTMAVRDLPAELPEWLETIGQEHVRRLSVRLLLDLLHLEGDTSRGAEIASDMGALTEDLILSGDYADAADLMRALAEIVGHAGANGTRLEAARRTLDEVADSLAFRELVALLGDLDEHELTSIRALCTALGAATVDVLRDVVATERPSIGSARAADLIVSCGKAAIPRLVPIADDRRTAARVVLAALLGRMRAPEGVPLLQTLVRTGDPAIVRAAVIALADIDDPSAARALHTVLRIASGAVRQAVVDALLSETDPRMLPLLVRVLDESDPLGQDHPVVLQTLAAMGAIRGDAAVPAVRRAMQHRRFFARRRTRALAEASAHTLAQIGSPAALAALNEARTAGHRALRRAAKAHGRADKTARAVRRGSGQSPD
jgi:hypothetical protein